MLEVLDIDEAASLVTKSLSLSLTDHQWIRPIDADIRWEKMNFFDNEFSENVRDLLFGKKLWTGELDMASPDLTSDGMLIKCWKIVDGHWCLLKSGEAPFMQEPYNEVATSIIAEVIWDCRM